MWQRLRCGVLVRFPNATSATRRFTDRTWPQPYRKPVFQPRPRHRRPIFRSLIWEFQRSVFWLLCAVAVPAAAAALGLLLVAAICQHLACRRDPCYDDDCRPTKQNAYSQIPCSRIYCPRCRYCFIEIKKQVHCLLSRRIDKTSLAAVVIYSCCVLTIDAKSMMIKYFKWRFNWCWIFIQEIEIVVTLRDKCRVWLVLFNNMVVFCSCFFCLTVFFLFFTFVNSSP